MSDELIGARRAMFLAFGECITKDMMPTEIADRLLAAATPPSPSTAPMCERKTAMLEKEGYAKTGYVLRQPGKDREVVVCDGGAVSWFTLDQWNWLMFNRNHVEFQWPKPIGSAPSTAPIAEDERAKFKAWWRKRVPPGDDSDHAGIFAFEVWCAALSSRPAGEVGEQYAKTAYSIKKPAVEVELPPLPEPRAIRAGDSFPKVYALAFTADQLRAYGQECARAALASKPAARDKETPCGS